MRNQQKRWMGGGNINRTYEQLDGLASIPRSQQVLTPEHQILRYRLSRMRAACRYTHRETGIGASADRLLRAGLLGEQVPVPIFRQKDVLPEETRRELLLAWRRWAETPMMCDWTGEHSLLTLLGLAASHFLADGECFFWVRHGEPMRLELIDPGRVPIYDYANVETGSVMGVKHTDTGSRDSYTVNQVPISNAHGSIYHAFYYKQVPASQMLHWRMPIRAFAVRGVPLLWPVVATTSTLDGFNAAAAKNAKLNAQRVGVLQESEVGGDGYKGDREAEDEDAMRGIIGWFRDEDRLLAPQIPYGTMLQPWPANFPVQAVEPFNRAITQQISAGLGFSHDELSGDLKGVNFSAGRLGKLTSRKSMGQIRVYLKEQVLNPVWDRFVSSASLAEKIPGLTGSDYSKLLNVEWPPPPPDPVDVRAQAMSDRLHVEMGSMSVSEIIRGRGGDPEAVFAEIKMERELLGNILPMPIIPTEAGKSDAAEDNA